MKKFYLFYILAGTFLAATLAYAGNGGNFVGGQSTATAASSAAENAADGPAQGEFKGCPMHHKKHRGFYHKLNLTEEQTKQLKDLKQLRREAMRGMFKQIKENRKALKEELAKPEPDMNAVNNLQTQLKAIHSQRIDDKLNSLLQIKKILTPEQFNTFLSKKGKWKKHLFKKYMHKKHHGKGGHSCSCCAGAHGKKCHKHGGDENEG